MTKSIYESLSVLSEKLHDKILSKGDVSVYDDEEKPHKYILKDIRVWLEKDCPVNLNHLEKDQRKLVLTVFNTILDRSLLPVDLVPDNYRTYESYYLNLHIINTNESDYADKHLGTMFRDGGSFGSLPLYDDYSEESNS